MDFSIFLLPDTWISLITLIFLEIVLGVDNIVFITLTSNRLPESKQSLGRKLGLAGAFLMRSLFLCFASFLASMTNDLFTISAFGWNHGISVHDIIMLAGGVYLIYKGISELKSTLGLNQIKAEDSAEASGSDSYHNLSLPKAIATIMVMDIVFSIDSVITAVGLAEHLLIMIFAVMFAIILMIIFIDAISNFINRHVEMTILALCFITVIGVLLVCEGLRLESGIEMIGMPAEKLMIYFSMVFAFIIGLIQIRYNVNLSKYREEKQLEEAEDAQAHAGEHARSEGDSACES